MRRAPYLALLFAAAVTGIIVESCGGGGSVTGGDPGAVDRIPIKLPLFTAWSTDLPDRNEGIASDPIKLVFDPSCDPSAAGCYAPFPAPAWSQSNGTATTSDFFRYRGVINLDPSFTTACATGPANQSLAFGAYPITWAPNDRTLQMGLELANESALCGKVPYLSVSYVRGLQGDPQPYILPWGHDPKLAFFVRFSNSPDLPSHARHLYIWAHYLDQTTGARYMAQRVLWSSWEDDAKDFAYPWTWPLKNSFQFAGPGKGPFLHGGTMGCDQAIGRLDVMGSTEWTVDLEKLAQCRFPKEDKTNWKFLGWELALEIGYLRNLAITGLPNIASMQLSDVGLSAIP